MLSKSIQRLFTNNGILIEQICTRVPKFTPFGFSTGKIVESEHTQQLVSSEYVLNPMVKHLAEINMRSERRNTLKQAVLNQNKNVIWAEIRKTSDKVIDLKNKGKCVGVIKRHPSKLNKVKEDNAITLDSTSELQQVDIVMEAKKMMGMRKNRSNGLMNVYVRAGGIEYRCILSSIDIHNEGWVQRVELTEYVPEEANELTIPIEITHVTQNPYLQQGGQFVLRRREIDIICYNHEHPTKFYVDCSFACPERAYRVGDLANTFPPGLILAPHATPNQKIVEIKQASKMQLHLKQKMMKNYLQSNKKEKQAPGQAKK